MKYTWILLVLALFSIYIANFLYRNQSPLDKAKINQELASENITTNTEAIKYIRETQDLGMIWNYINLRNFFLSLAFIDLAIVCGFSSIHTFIDKLFFKKFYEEADWKMALRRGAELAIFISGLIFLRLSAGLSPFTVFPLFFIILGLEYLITAKTQQKKMI